MTNEKLQLLLFKKKKEGKTITGLGKHLGMTFQGADHIVKKKDLSKVYNQLKEIANYMECNIDDIID